MLTKQKIPVTEHFAITIEQKRAARTKRVMQKSLGCDRSRVFLPVTIADAVSRLCISWELAAFGVADTK